MNRAKLFRQAILVVGISVLLPVSSAKGDAVIDWNQKACDVVVAAKLTPPAAARAMALVQTAVYEAVNGITKRYAHNEINVQASGPASIEAAVAAANRVILTKLLPAQRAAIDATYQSAVAAIGDGPAKAEGIAIGEKAAAAVLAQRADDLSDRADSYRPHAAAGVYVPTALPIASQWPQRTPWLMKKADQFRPGPPPALTSEQWARDYNEVKELGGKNSTRRTVEQTAIARFWEAAQPPIYHSLVRSAAGGAGREITRNARLFAAVTQALDDAYIAVFDAKYHYNFWRPITAIRNGDLDGNEATERDASWTPFIDTPMHPEYPCAHCILSGAVATVLQAEFSGGPAPAWTTSSPTANGAARSWATLEKFMEEVANARIYDGVHYRSSTEVGTAMGKQIGALVAAKYLTDARPGAR